MQTANRPTVAIIGAGFGGLYAARTLADQPVNVLLIDRYNFHLFSPLLYQVATSGLDPSDIAYPVRAIFKGKENVRFMLGNVVKIDHHARVLHIQTNGRVQQEPYDDLIIAAGSQTHYFGMEQVERHAFGLKTLPDAVVLRNHILKCFEKAAWAEDPARRDALMTLVIVGGGPTGLEMAGALHELYTNVLREEYAQQFDGQARVILVEMQDHLLTPYPKRLQKAALRQLEDLGVEVLLGVSVTEVEEDHVTLSDGRVIPTYTLIWAAGVRATPIGDLLDGIELHRSGRIPVRATMEAIGCQHLYVVGDLAYLEDQKGQPYPMLIPVAKQQGILAARNILRRLNGESAQTFHYRDRGIMATIGRRRAVAWIYYKIQLTGYPAWFSWLGLHLITLMGFRNRVSVFVNWIWNYFTYDRSVRMILEHHPRGTYGEPAEEDAPAEAEREPAGAPRW